MSDRARRAARSAGFASSGFFALRTPLLPWEEFLGWGAGLTAGAAGPQELGDALATDARVLRARLRQLVSRPEVREALFVASPVLDGSLAAWLDAPDSEAGLKVERTLVRYVSRMAARCTPFGLFAGCSVGRPGAETALALPPRHAYQRHTRLDMDYVDALTAALVEQPEVKGALTYRPNSSLYAAAGRLRYAEVRRTGKARSYHLVEVEPTGYLTSTLARAGGGAQLGALARALVEDDPEVSLQEAGEYVDSLVHSQLLVPDLLPAVTGPEPIHSLLAQAQALPGLAGVAAALASVRDALERLDGAGLGAPAERYHEVAAQLAPLPVPVELPRLFQVDMLKPASGATLGPEVLAEVSRGVQLLQRLTPRPTEDGLSRFRRSFVERYEQREVPLVEALDEELGVGFETSSAPGTGGNPLLDGLAFPGSAGEATGDWGPRTRHLMSLLQEAVRRGVAEVELGPEDLERLAAPEPAPLPDGFAVMGTLLGDSEQAVREGRFLFVFDGAGGPSGADMLGRFCHGDPALHRHVQAHLRAEESLRPGALFAEVAHLPEGRVGNILCRPVLRGHEVPFLGRSGAPEERQLPVTDLRVCVQGERVVLRSARLGCEVVPRLTTAHNTSRGLGLYRFLCALQGRAMMGFSWGPLAGAPFLPRVRAGRVVLAPARWEVPGRTLGAWAEARGAERFGSVQAFRAEARLPRYVAVKDGDNELPVDLDNVLSVESLVQLVGRRPSSTLVELLPGAGPGASGPEGSFFNELIIPFVRTPAPDADPPPAARPRPPVRLPRRFPPGSEWLYAKLYGGPAVVDRLVRETVPEVVHPSLASGAADGWFFIRYSDPAWHLRLRLHGPPARLAAEVLPRLEAATAPLLAEGSLWRVQLDTYERELERYGGDAGMPLLERLFQHDSEAAVELLQALPGEAAAHGRWRLALCGMDRLLDTLGLELPVRHALLQELRDRFARELRADARLERQLGDRFRRERAALEALLTSGEAEGGPLAAGLAALHRGAARSRDAATRLLEAGREGRLTCSLAELAGSLLHMHANRVLRSEARPQELVLYDLLTRLYASRLARARKAGAGAAP